jgi:glutamyl-tRNA reductase
VVPTIRALRDHFGQVGAAEADKVIALLHKKELGPAERDAAIRRAIDLVIAKLLHHPQMALKADESEALAGCSASTPSTPARPSRPRPPSSAAEPLRTAAR